MSSLVFITAAATTTTQSSCAREKQEDMLFPIFRGASQRSGRGARRAVSPIRRVHLNNYGEENPTRCILGTEHRRLCATTKFIITTGCCLTNNPQQLHQQQRQIPNALHSQGQLIERIQTVTDLERAVREFENWTVLKKSYHVMLLKPLLAVCKDSGYQACPSSCQIRRVFAFEQPSTNSPRP